MSESISRESLAQRTLTFLHDAIRRGEWGEVMPSERSLSQRLGVSRPVLRAALRSLEISGLISNERGRVRRILSSGKRLTSRKPKICFLVGNEYFAGKILRDPLITYAGEFLAKQKFQTEIHPQSMAAAMLKQRDPHENRVWVLASVSRSVQQLFVEKGLRVIVAGSTFPNISLPSIDIDHRAVARHAVAHLVRNCHQRIAFVTTDRPRAGDLETEEGFREECGRGRARGIRPPIVRSSLLPDALMRKLKALLLSKNPPSALFVGNAPLALMALTVAQSLRIQVPDQLSIVSRDFGEYFAYTFPPIANYSLSQVGFARRLVSLILQASPQVSASRLFPAFRAEQSIARRN